MVSKITQIGTKITFEDLFSGYKSIFIDQGENFIRELSGYLPSRYVFLVSSGTAACYIILQVLKETSSKKEVILPAYTASTVALAVLKAKLRPILCDISLEDFNINLDILPEIVTKDTLCIIPVHMFGIPVYGIEGLNKRIPDVFIIEDCAQSLGSKIKEKNTGSFCDIGFLSFNRGKNLSTYGGGCIFTNSEKLAEKIKIELNKLEEQSTFSKFSLLFKMIALSLAVRPRIYGILYPAISRFKDNQVPEKFSVEKYTNFQAGVGLSLLERIDKFSAKRYQNGIVLINGLVDIKDIIAPSISKNAEPAFSRLPIVFKDLKRREKAEKRLWKAGIDTSRMYLRPIHHIFDLGYKKEDFPNATYVAERLLTLPTHPLIDEKIIIKMIDVIRKVLT